MKIEDFLEHEINRRQFLGSSAANAAGMAAGVVGLSSSVAQASSNERIALGVIGVRNQGRTLAKTFASLAEAEVAAICDVDESLLPPASREIAELQGRAPRKERDFRRLLDDPSLDAVVVATPDHWHAAMTVAACAAGKDVYVEAPPAHAIEEGRRMVEAAGGRIVQTGLQQRSGAHFRSAVEYVRSGKLGTVRMAKAWLATRRKPIGTKPDTAVPPGVDYELWSGPAGPRPFNPNRFHGNWQWFWDYGSGELGRWGVHLLDVARWGLDVELPGRVSASGGRFHLDDDRETPDTLLVTYDYPEATILWEHRSWTTHGVENRSAGVAFYGDEGTLIVDRGGWKVYDRKDGPAADASELRRTHCADFLRAVKTREQPAADIRIGHVSSALCHAGNIAYRLGREIRFDHAPHAPGRPFDDDDANAASLPADHHGWMRRAIG